MGTQSAAQGLYAVHRFPENGLEAGCTAHDAVGSATSLPVPAARYMMNLLKVWHDVSHDIVLLEGSGGSHRERCGRSWAKEGVLERG